MKKWSRDPSGHGITEGVIWQQQLLFFFPILLGTFFQQLYNTADAMIVGKTFVSTLFTLFGICVLRLAWLLGYVSAHPDLRLTVISYPVTWVITSALFIGYYCHWRRTELAGKNVP